jgi:uncharacterized membrane protein
MTTGSPALKISEDLKVPHAVPAADGRRAGGGQRYGFVDLLRGFALVVMIETHVVNAYLPAALRNSGFFFWLSFVNGLVAPSFLFASGFSLVLQARRKWEEWLRCGPAFRKQMRRLGFILLVAYYIHLPDFGLSKFLVPHNPVFWKRGFQVDVLQCIVVSLLAINALILLTRRRGAFFWAAAAAGVIAALATPWLWAQDFTIRMPLFLALYLNPHGVSLFPLFPWISFVVAGSCAAHLFLNAVEQQADARCMRYASVVGAAAIAGGLLARGLPLFSSWHAGFYRTSPLYVLIRLGCVVLLCALLYAMEKRLGWVPGAIRLAGQESLLVYTLHLLLIFSVLRSKPVAALLGLEAGYAACFLMSAAIIVLMLGLARFWHSLKGSNPRTARAVLAGVVVVNIILFLIW